MGARAQRERMAMELISTGHVKLEGNGVKMDYNYNLNKNQVAVFNGSDELLSFCFQIFTQKGVAFADITYGFYPVFAELNGIPYEQIPLKSDFTIDVNDYINEKGTIFIANPNAL